MRLTKEIETIKGNESAMAFCDTMAVSIKLYGDASVIEDAHWLSAELAKDGIDVSMMAVMAVAKELSK